MDQMDLECYVVTSPRHAKKIPHHGCFDNWAPPSNLFEGALATGQDTGKQVCPWHPEHPVHLVPASGRVKNMRGGAMEPSPKLHPQYVTNVDGHRTAVILPVEEYEEL